MASSRTETAPAVGDQPVPAGPWARLATWLEHPLSPYTLVLGSSGILLLIGIVMVLSASSVFAADTYGTSTYFFLRQVVFVCVGVVAAAITARLPLWVLRRLAFVSIMVATGLTALTYVPGFGKTVNGSTNWVSFGSEALSVQPSELAKLALVLFGAHVYATKGPRVGELRHVVLPFVPLAGLLVLLVVGQRDLGQPLILAAIVLGVMWTAGVPARILVAGGLLGALGTAAAVNAEAYRIGRFTSFLDPFADINALGYQAANSLYAVGSGGWWGAGLGAGGQKWGRLPEAHTDFIFAVIAEELGLVGSLLVLVLFLALAYGMVRIAMRTPDPFGRLVVAGVAAWVLVQAVVNLGGAVALLPITGVPLPLVSYGGSAMIVTLVGIGAVLAVARNDPTVWPLLGGRRRRRAGPRRRRPGPTGPVPAPTSTSRASTSVGPR